MGRRNLRDPYPRQLYVGRRSWLNEITNLDPSDNRHIVDYPSGSQRTNKVHYPDSLVPKVRTGITALLNTTIYRQDPTPNRRNLYTSPTTRPCLGITDHNTDPTLAHSPESDNNRMEARRFLSNDASPKTLMEGVLWVGKKQNAT